MKEYTIDFGEHEEYTRTYMEAKGYLSFIKLAVDGKVYRLNFYDPVRLAQCLESEIGEKHPCFFEKNLVVIPSITEENIRKAIESILENGTLSEMVAEEA